MFDKLITEVAGPLLPAAFIGIMIAFSWHFGREICSFFTRKYLTKIDGNYVTVDDCARIRANCEVVKSVKADLVEIKHSHQQMRAALRILVIHAIPDRKTQEDALEELG